VVIASNDGYPVGYTVTAMGTDTSEFLYIEYRTDGRAGQSSSWSRVSGR
jgi:septal ring factor EnvC (AmiA/AmiB activator)